MSVDVAHAPDTLLDPVAAACDVIRGTGPNSPPRIQQQSQDAEQDPPQSPPRDPVTIDLTGGKEHFCDDEDVAALMEAWSDENAPVPDHVTSLDLSINKVSDDGVRMMSEAIAKRQGSKLQNIDLDGNELTDSAVAALTDNLLKGASATNGGPCLTRLDLSSNQITDAGVKALVEGCYNGQNSTLKTLLLRSNDITDEGMERMCVWLEEATCPLNTLHISGNTFTEGIVNAIAKALKSNVNLTDLNISNTMPQLVDPTPLVEAVQANESLLTLTMGFGGKKYKNPEIDAALRRNKLSVQRRGEFVEQLKAQHRQEIADLKAAHATEVERLEDEIAMLRLKINQQ